MQKSAPLWVRNWCQISRAGLEGLGGAEVASVIADPGVEKAVEDVVLNGVITRFSDMVGVGNLHKITGLRKQDADDIVILWKKGHRMTEAHLQAMNKDMPVAGLEEIKTDVESIQLLVDNVNKYRAKPAEA